MIDHERLYDLLMTIIEEVDEDEYPESFDIIDGSMIPEGGIVLEEPYEIAGMLMGADRTMEMPPQIADLMAEVLIAEINDGNYGAATDLGSLYYTGRIGVQDYAQAMRYYQIAADQGEPVAQENLGYCYYYGRNGEKDYERAYYYFSLGAFAGLPGSLYKIGDMFRYGYYVDSNPREAFNIYTRCLNELDDDSIRQVGADIMLRMADCLFEGIGTEPDAAQALFFYQRAEQMFFDRIRNGDFMVKKNYQKAIERQKEARERAQQNMPDYDWTRYE